MSDEPTAIQPRRAERVKRCGGCGRYGLCSPRRERTDFYVRQRRPDGGASGYQSRCKECRREDSREYLAANRQELNERHRDGYRRRVQDPEYAQRLRDQNREAKRRARERDPETVRAATRAAARKYRASIDTPEYRAERARERRQERQRLKREDPKAYQLLLAKERAWARDRLQRPGYRESQREAARLRGALRRRDAGIPPRNFQRATVDREPDRHLPAWPLLTWLHRTVVPRLATTQEVADRLDVDEAIVRRLRDGSKGFISLKVADRMLTRWGGLTTIYDLWPELTR